jgi:hypothetical protein
VALADGTAVSRPPHLAGLGVRVLADALAPVAGILATMRPAVELYEAKRGEIW